VRFWIYCCLQVALAVQLPIAILWMSYTDADDFQLRLVSWLALTLLANQLIDWVVFPRWKRRRVKHLLGTLWGRLLLGVVIAITIVSGMLGYTLIHQQQKILTELQAKQMQEDLHALTERIRWTEDGARLDIPLFRRPEFHKDDLGEEPERAYRRRNDDEAERPDRERGPRRPERQRDRERQQPRREGDGDRPQRENGPRGRGPRWGRGRSLRLPSIVYLVDGQGETLFAWPESLDPVDMDAIRQTGQDLMIDEMPQRVLSSDTVRWVSTGTTTVGNEEYRITGIRLYQPRAPRSRTNSVELYVAEPTEPIETAIENLSSTLLLNWAGMIAATFVLVFFITRLTLRKLGPLSEQIATRGEDDLRPLETEKLPNELTGIVQRFNGLLGRVDQTIRRERTLTADIAHELRTPLAGARSVLEVSLSQARSDEDYRAAMDQVLEIVESTRQMIEKLLMLARLDSGQITAGDVEGIGLRSFLRRQWQQVADKAESQHVRLDDAHVGEDLAVRADRALLEVILGNLLSNAVTYGSPGGRIHVTARRQDGQVRLAISNPAETLPSDPEKVFDRFWQAEDARSRTGLHCGLGLSLVRQCAEAMGGAASAHAVGGTFTVEVQLPAWTDPDAEAPEA
jgi:signal transduction histidine kinase